MDFDSEFLKDRYDYELDRKDKLTAALALPVGVLGVLGSAGVAMVRTFSFADTTLTVLFVPVIGIGFVTFTACLILLCWAFVAQTYVYLPLLRDIDGWDEAERQWLDYVKGTGGTLPDGYEEETTSSALRKRIIAAADSNTLSNDRRSKRLHWSRVALLWTVAAAYAAAIVYVADQVRFAMPKQETPTPAPATNTPQASVPERPTFPPNRVIREGREPQHSETTIEKK
jgi:hypothetical protein